MFEFGILGPLDVRHDGSPVVCGRRRERALLAVLLLSANRVVPADRLAQDLASDGGPTPTPAALRVYVSRLRSALRPPVGPELLLTHPGGYELRLGPEAVDADRFTALGKAARAALAAGDHGRARAVAEQALAIWRGPALLEYRDAPFAEATAARLDSARLSVAEDRFEAMLECGEHRGAIGELEQFTREHPLRERCWALRMHALYRDGRQGEALTVYRELRGLLRDELGLEPSAPLRDLELALLRQDPELDLPGRHDEPDPNALPARLATPPDIRFVGRAGELATLLRAFKEVESGAGQTLMLVAGEPGIGKTALCSEFARIAADRGALVLYGRCEDELSIPYQPFAEALTHYVAGADGPVLAAHVAEHGGELAALVPALRRRVSDLPAPLSAEGDAARYVLFRAAVGLLGAAGRDRAVVLVLDDLHWADTPTLLLLRYLAGLAEPVRVLVIGTYRPSELSGNRPLVDTLAELRRQGHARLELGGLTEVDVLALLETVAGQSLDEPFVALSRQLHGDTDGNPYFVGELMRHLGETGIVRETDGQWQIHGRADAYRMPASLQEVVGARVGRLGPRAEHLLAHAAVLGRDFSAEVLGRVCQIPETELVAELDRACAATIVVDLAPGHYGFVHAAIASTLYDALSPTRRSLIHRQVADALELVHGAGPGPRVAEIAHHWLAATPGVAAGKPVDYARWAGQAALAARAPEEAVMWFSAAVRLLGPAGDGRLRGELGVELGTAQRLAGDLAHRETLLATVELSASIGAPDLMAAAALANNRGTVSASGFVDAERVAALRVALEATPQPTRTRALLLATLAVELSFNSDWPARRALAREATALARSLGDDEAVVRVHNLLYFGILLPETLQERLDGTAQAVALAGEDPDPAVRHWVHRLRYYTCADAGRREDMDVHLPALYEAASASGDPAMQWSALFIRQGRALLAGRLDESERLATEGFAVGTAGGMLDAPIPYVFGLGATRILQDRAVEVVETYEAAATQAPGIPFLRSHLARLYCLVGRDDDARAMFAPDAATSFSAFEPDCFWLYGITAYAEVAARLGDADAAAVLYEQLAPWHGQTSFLFFDNLGSVAHQLGMLATTVRRFKVAETHFAQALETHEHLAAPALAAATHLETARMLLLRAAPGDAERAAAVVEVATAVCADHGFDALAREAAGLAAAATPWSGSGHL